LAVYINYEYLANESDWSIMADLNIGFSSRRLTQINEWNYLSLINV
jgi:hypothetical protein